VSHVALRTGIMFTKFQVDQPICSWLMTFLLLIRHVMTLILDPVILTFVMDQLSRDQTLYHIIAKSNNLQRNYCNLKHRPPPWIWPKADFPNSQFIREHNHIIPAYPVSTQPGNAQLSYWWFSRFFSYVFHWRHLPTHLSS